MFGSQTRQVLGSEPAPKATAEAPQESETTMAAMETDWLEPESPTGTYDTFGSETMAKAAQALATSHIVNDKSLEFKNNLKLKSLSAGAKRQIRDHDSRGSRGASHSI